MRSIYILGANGQLGKEFVNYLLSIKYKTFITFDRKLDISNNENIKFSLNCLNKGDVVINCAAYNNVYAPDTGNKENKEIEQAKCFKTNALGPKYLATICKNKGAKLIHFSTNYVFEDSRCTMKSYSEFDDTNPYLFYGFSKLCGEKLIKELIPDQSIIIRTSWLFSKEGSLVKAIKAHAKEGTEMHASAAIGNPTYTLDLVKQAIHLAGNGVVGTYHCVSTDKTSKKQYIDKIISLLKLDVKTVTKHPGPSISLDNFMLNLENLNKMRNWEESIEDCFK